MNQTFLRRRLEKRLKKYLSKHKPLLVFVTGSTGKSETVQAIATVLAEKYRVRAHTSDEHSFLTVPVAMMGITYPVEQNEWKAALSAMNTRIKEEKDVDVIVQELPTEKPGDLAQFMKYMTPDVAVVTAVSDEHDEVFGSLDAIAMEELSIAKYAKLTVIGRDDIDGRFAKYADTHTVDTYGLSELAEYRFVPEPADPLRGRIGKILTPEWGESSVTVQLVGDHSLKTAAAAACVGAKLGLTSQQVVVGLSKLSPAPGRMNVLAGAEKTTIIDDSYDASPVTMVAALQTLLAAETSQRIAIFGPLGGGRATADIYAQIGSLCNPTEIDWVVTVGETAGQHLAAAAQQSGCQVKACKTSFEAGGFVRGVMKPGAVTLVSGAANAFMEEAVKGLLHSNLEQEDMLVRQSPEWTMKKEAVFDHDVPED